MKNKQDPLAIGLGIMPSGMFLVSVVGALVSIVTGNVTALLLATISAVICLFLSWSYAGWVVSN